MNNENQNRETLLNFLIIKAPSEQMLTDVKGSFHG